MWLGRENEENVARTRYWCGWPSSPHIVNLVGSDDSYGRLSCIIHIFSEINF